MSDLQRRVAEAARTLEPQYSTLDATLFEADVRRRHRERRVRRRALAAAGVVLLVAIVGGVRWKLTQPPGLPEVAIGEDARVVMPIDAPVRTVKSEPGLVWLEVERDAARFVVAPQHGRTVRVSAAGVDVEVVGTAFSVAREGPQQVRVVVTEGRVRVRAGQRESLLSKGEQGLFVSPPPVAAVEPPPPEPEPEVEDVIDVPAPEPKRKATKSKRSKATWRALAERGDFGSAWTALQQEDAPDDEPGDLLRAADVARLSGHPAASLTPLRRVLSHFRTDPRASLAAFTLGRVLLDDLGN
ncbi:MAG: FecR domain-containing protein, partial [Archangium sp.]